MKLATIFLAMMFTIVAHAERQGKDERIWDCVSSAESQEIGPNENFTVHETKGDKITVTRVSDGKWRKMAANNSGYYVTSAGESTLWPADMSGYTSGVEENGSMIVAYSISQGHYKNNRMACTINKVISEFEPLTATEKVLIDIGDNAYLANGGYEVRKFDITNLDLAEEMKALKENEFEGCTWTEVVGQDAILEMIKTEAEDPDAAKAIETISTNPGLVGMIALISDNDISCSQRYVWLYTKDGVQLELMYSQGD